MNETRLDMLYLLGILLSAVSLMLGSLLIGLGYLSRVVGWL